MLYHAVAENTIRGMGLELHTTLTDIVPAVHGAADFSHNKT